MNTLYKGDKDNNNYNNTVANMQLGHFLARSSLTHPEVSLMVPSASFCLLVCSCLLSSVIYYQAFCLHVATSLFCIPVFSPKLGLYLFPLPSQPKCISPTAVFLIHCVSALNSTVNGKIKYATAAVAYLILPFILLFKASRHAG